MRELKIKLKSDEIILIMKYRNLNERSKGSVEQFVDERLQKENKVIKLKIVK